MIIYLSSDVVVEIDLPYDDSQMERYGEAFKTWQEEDFSQFMGGLTSTLVAGALAIVVSL